MITSEKPSESALGIGAKRLIAGGVAGCCAKTIVAPIDRVNILLQGNHRYYKKSGPLDAFNRVLKYDGLPGLFKGHGAQLLRIIPYAATQFYTYELIKQSLENRFGHHMYTKFFAGSCAGMAAAAFTYPLDNVRTLIAFQPTGTVAYSGTWQAFSILHTEGGRRALYKGFSPTLVGMVFYAGCSFSGFEALKKYCLEHYRDYFGKACPKNDGQLVLTIPGKLLCGAVPATCALIFSYPFSVVRRKMQVSSVVSRNSHRFNTSLATAQYIYNKRGVAGLYKGVGIASLKVSPMVAVSFCVYEVMKEWLGLESHSGDS